MNRQDVACAAIELEVKLRITPQGAADGHDRTDV